MVNEVKVKKSVKKKVKKTILSGCIYIQSSFNNTIITITDDRGNVINWGSSGAAGFKGTNGKGSIRSPTPRGPAGNVPRPTPATPTPN